MHIRKVMKGIAEKVFFSLWTVGIAAAVWGGLTLIHCSLREGNPLLLLPGLSLLFFVGSALYKEFRFTLQTDKKK